MMLVQTSAVSAQDLILGLRLDLLLKLSVAVLLGGAIGLERQIAGKPAGWSLTLRPASFESILKEGERLNAGFFGYCERTEAKAIARLRRVAPEKLEELVGGIMSPSPIGLPTSAFPRR